MFTQLSSCPHCPGLAALVGEQEPQCPLHHPMIVADDIHVPQYVWYPVTFQIIVHKDFFANTATSWHCYHLVGDQLQCLLPVGSLEYGIYLLLDLCLLLSN